MIKEEQLKKQIGGVSLNPSLINSVIKSIETILNLGRYVGTAIKRGFTSSICKV